jgi:thiamine-monophosphate kinase
VGIGDDAAVLRAPGQGEMVWTVDAQVEGVHFRREWLTLADIGYRSFVAAASDLFAMGAEPWCALSSLALPSTLADSALDALAEGQAEAAHAAMCPIVGGNLSRASELSVTTTLLGTTPRAVRRGGARVGDGIYLEGESGLAALGLAALESGATTHEVEAAVQAFRRPRVRLESGRRLGVSAHAAIDVSDGLSTDIGHLADASHVACVLDEEALLAHVGVAVRAAASALGRPLLETVLHGGEDYALALCADAPVDGFTRVGVVESGEGVWLAARDGTRRRLTASGFDHFGRSHP